MLSFFESILYGFISGCAEILPLSAKAHQSVMIKLFGLESELPLCNLFIHLALIFAIYYSCSNSIMRLRREGNASSNRRGRTYKSLDYYDRRLIKSAVLPMVLGLFLNLATRNISSNLLLVALFTVISATILFIQDHLPIGNRNSSKMTSMDATFIGLFGALSVFTGISRNGMILSYSIARGVDRQNAVNWMLMLTLPALVALCVLDIISIFIVGFGISSFLGFLFCLIAAAFAFLGGYLSTMVVRALAVNSGYTGIAYYTFGAALFSVVLYLIS